MIEKTSKHLDNAWMEGTLNLIRKHGANAQTAIRYRLSLFSFIDHLLVLSLRLSRGNSTSFPAVFGIEDLR